MSHRRRLFIVAAAMLAGAPSVLAQVSPNGLVSQSAANRLGLERVWFTQIELDRSRGRVAHLTQHVSSRDSYTVFEVHYDGGRMAFFSERDLDRFGVPLGKAGAKKLADQKVDDLKRLNLNPRLSTHVVPEITLYAVTDRAVLQALDAETGRTRWVTAVGSLNHPSEAAEANDQYVALVNGSTLYVLDKNNGKLVWQRKSQRTPGAGPVVSSRCVYIPMVDGALESYQLEDFRQAPWIIKAHGRAIVKPTLSGSHVAWPTDRGHLYVAEENRNLILYRLETNNAIVAPAVMLPPDRIVVASTDGYVYCLHERNGAIQWRFSTGEPVVRSPLVVGNLIFVPTDRDNLFRISADGEEQWLVQGIRALVAASQKRLYCLNSTGRLTILDIATGARIGVLPTETLDLVFANKQTDRILLGTSTGTLQCLRELEQTWPLIHAGVMEEKPAADASKAAPKKKSEAQPPDRKGPPATDPFGAPLPSGQQPEEKPSDAGTDPFSVPAPAPAGNTPADDPFKPSAPPKTGGATDDPFAVEPKK